MRMDRQIESGVLRCVKTGAALRLDAARAMLLSGPGAPEYPLIHGVPHLIADSAGLQSYAQSNPAMVAEYAPARPSLLHTLWTRLRAQLARDWRTKASRRAFDTLLTSITEDHIALSVGGGPARPDARLTNLNIAPFPNVDIVADAHVLPYGDNTVDAVYCEAVLEHLADPNQAMREMARVLKPGGRLLAITPFLQPYHGYPHHYQNFTLTGHRLLAERAGLTLEDSGSATGPCFGLSVLICQAFNTYLPRPFNRIFYRLAQAITLPLRPLDALLDTHPDRHALSSSTFVLCRK